MSKMTGFRYGSFYDVPRAIVLKHRAKYFYLGSPFSENADEYPDEYSVYLFPATMEAAAASSSWDFLSELGSLIYVGSVNIKEVRFDTSKRKEIDATVLDQFLQET